MSAKLVADISEGLDLSAKLFSDISEGLDLSAKLVSDISEGLDLSATLVADIWAVSEILSQSEFLFRNAGVVLLKQCAGLF